MISTEKLIEKKKFYEEKKAEISAKDFSPEVQKEVAEFRAQKEQEIKDFENKTNEKYELARKEDIKACDHYIQFVDTLIEEDRGAEQSAAMENATEADAATV